MASPTITRYFAAAGQIEFPFSFPIFFPTDVELYIDGRRQESGFTVEPAVGGGGRVLLAFAPTAGAQVSLRRQLPTRRISGFEESGAFRVKAVDDELNYRAEVDQQLESAALRAVRLSPLDQDASLELPPATQRAGRVLAFDAQGDVSLATVVGETLGGFQARESGAIARTAQEKLWEAQLSPQDFGAAGDGVADDTAALLAWQDALDAAVSGTGALAGHVPAGTYLVSAPVPFKGSFRGAGGGTVIKAAPGFVGDMLIDFNAGAAGKSVKDVTFDVRGHDIKCFGSSSAGGAGGSSLSVFETCRFLSTSITTYAVGGASGLAEAGMLTGASFVNCTWSAPLALQVGANQDDVTFINPRFDNANGGADRPVLLMGNNIRLQGVYYGIANSFADGLNSAIFGIGGNPVVIDGIFIEDASTAGTNVRWGFLLGGPTHAFSLRNVVLSLNYQGGSADQALIRLNQTSGVNSLCRLSIENVKRSSSLAGGWNKLVNAFIYLPSATGTQSVTVQGCDEYDFIDLFSIGAGGTGNDNALLRLSGSHRGRRLHHVAGSNLVWKAELPAAAAAAALQNAVTGDGSAHRVQFATELADHGGDLALDTFTAPLAGLYALTAHVGLIGLTAAHTQADLRIVTSNRSYFYRVNAWALASGGYASLALAVHADMDAGDTAHVSVQVAGGAKVVSVSNGGETAFGVHMVGG